LRCSSEISRSRARRSAQALELGEHLLRAAACSSAGGVAERPGGLLQVCEGAHAGDGLDAAHALGDAGLADDREQADVAGRSTWVPPHSSTLSPPI
jgi:hypothetical protein